MKSLLTLTTVSMIALSSLAHAEATKPAGEPHKMMQGEHGKGDWKPAASRQDAITRTKEKLQKLESMSDEEWKTHREERMKKRQERREKLANMSPEERKAMQEKMKVRHGEKSGDAPAPDRQ